MAAQLPIVVCGESLLDVFDNGATPAGLALDAVVGGSPLNVAMGLVRMGQPAVFFGGVSRDFLGERILRSIRQEGIAEDALVLCDAPTTLSLVGVDAQGVPSYRFYGHAAADRQLLPEHLERLPAQVAAIHLEHPNPARGPGVPEETTMRLQGERRRRDDRHVIGASPRR
jgi:fructokinase